MLSISGSDTTIQPASSSGTASSTAAAVAVSVVVPVADEAGNIVPQIEEITAALGNARPYEIVYVDDASTDATAAELKTARARFPELRVVTHASRCGQSAAITSGVLAAQAPLIVTLDGDRQNDPADIPRLLEQFHSADAGPDIGLIAGQRTRRSDSVTRRLSSRLANGIRSSVLRDDTPDTGCGLKVFRREAFLRLPFFNGLHRFLPALMRRAGYGVALAPVNHRPRTVGRAKYGIHNRLWVGIVDLVMVWWLIRRCSVPEIVKDQE